MEYQQPVNLMYYSGSPYRQAGFGLRFYRRNAYSQKGRGVGSFFAKLMKTLIPFARDTLLPAAKKHLFPHATQMAKNVTRDVLSQNMSLRESLKQHGMTALKGVGDSVGGQSGSGLRSLKTRKRSAKKAKSSRKPIKRLKVKKKKSKSRKSIKNNKTRRLTRRDIFG